VEKAELIWKNGEFVPWDEANVHVLTHGLHYGTGVFEGIRCYDTEIGPAIFRHQDHLDRLAKSAELYYLPLNHDLEEIREATKELIRRNGLRSCYIRPLAFRGYGEMGLFAQSAPVDVIIAVWPWGAYLGEEGKRNGIRAKVSSWRRISPSGLIPHAKASGQYLNSILAKTESANAGYDEAILLDDLGYTVVERDIARAELYMAEEVFLTGTAAELVPVREIDDHDIGEPGEITRVIQAKFDDALHGRLEEYREWLDPVGEPTGKAPPEPTAAEVDAEEVGEPASRTLGS
jgi:branched-chain amino acid aminotransferase